MIDFLIAINMTFICNKNEISFLGTNQLFPQKLFAINMIIDSLNRI